MDSPDILTVGPEFDRLGREAPAAPPQWAGQTPTKKVAVIATMRDEGLSILEWVAHYRVIGADTIYIYTNDNRDGSDALLEALANAGVIRFRPNPVARKISPQHKAYRHAFAHSPDVWQHEWVAFLDGDEFLFPVLDGEQWPLPAYLDKLREVYGCSAVCLNWKWFAGDRAFSWTPGLLLERFTKASDYPYVKTIFRLGDVRELRDAIHVPDLKPGSMFLTGRGDLQRASEIKAQADPGYALGQVNHYWNKSFQEFSIKRAKGFASGNWFGRRHWHDFHWYPGVVSEDSPPTKSTLKTYASKWGACGHSRACGQRRHW